MSKILFIFYLFFSINLMAQNPSFCDSSSKLKITDYKISKFIDTTFENSLIDNKLWTGEVNFYELNNLRIKYLKDSVFLLIRGFEVWSVTPIKQFYKEERLKNPNSCFIKVNKKKYLILENTDSTKTKIEIYQSFERSKDDSWVWRIMLDGKIPLMKKENYLDFWNLIDEITTIK